MRLHGTGTRTGALPGRLSPMSEHEKTPPKDPASRPEPARQDGPARLSDPAPLKPDGTPRQDTPDGTAGPGEHGRPTDDSDPGHS